MEPPVKTVRRHSDGHRFRPCIKHDIDFQNNHGTTPTAKNKPNEFSNSKCAPSFDTSSETKITASHLNGRVSTIINSSLKHLRRIQKQLLRLDQSSRLLAIQLINITDIYPSDINEIERDFLSRFMHLNTPKIADSDEDSGNLSYSFGMLNFLNKYGYLSAISRPIGPPPSTCI